MLFLVYANDLIPYMEGAKIVLYVDDMQFMH